MIFVWKTNRRTQETTGHIYKDKGDFWEVHTRWLLSLSAEEMGDYMSNGAIVAIEGNPKGDYVYCDSLGDEVMRGRLVRNVSTTPEELYPLYIAKQIHQRTKRTTGNNAPIELKL